MRLLIFFLFLAVISSCQTTEQKPTTDNVVSREIIELEQPAEELAIEESMDFVLEDPDTALILKKYKLLDYQQSIAYLYLTTNYKSIALDSLKHYDYEESENRFCAFTETFEYNIQYSKDDCSMEGGIGESIIFPLIDTLTMKAFIQKLFEDDNNTWTDNMNYEADGAGCYYNVTNTDTTSKITIYCGC